MSEKIKKHAQKRIKQYKSEGMANGEILHWMVVYHGDNFTQSEIIAMINSETANYEQEQLDNIRDDSILPDCTPYNLKLSNYKGDSTNWLNITHKQLLAIREILAD